VAVARPRRTSTRARTCATSAAASSRSPTSPRRPYREASAALFRASSSRPRGQLSPAGAAAIAAASPRAVGAAPEAPPLPEAPRSLALPYARVVSTRRARLGGPLPSRRGRRPRPPRSTRGWGACPSAVPPTFVASASRIPREARPRSSSTCPTATANHPLGAAAAARPTRCSLRARGLSGGPRHRQHAQTQYSARALPADAARPRLGVTDPMISLIARTTSPARATTWTSVSSPSGQGSSRHAPSWIGSGRKARTGVDHPRRVVSAASWPPSRRRPPRARAPPPEPDRLAAHKLARPLRELLGCPRKVRAGAHQCRAIHSTPTSLTGPIGARLCARPPRAREKEIHGPRWRTHSHQLAQATRRRACSEAESLPGIRRRKTGPSTYADTLAELAACTPCPPRSRLPRLSKLKCTYIDRAAGPRHPQTGRHPTSFNQAVAALRLS